MGEGGIELFETKQVRTVMSLVLCYILLVELFETKQLRIEIVTINVELLRTISRLQVKEKEFRKISRKRVLLLSCMDATQ